jgi:Ca2+-binding RTX toxin-like protein
MQLIYRGIRYTPAEAVNSVATQKTVRYRGIAYSLNHNSNHHVIHGNDGDDQISDSVLGNDKVYGDDGNDKITVNGGDDLIKASAGNDTIELVGGGTDTIFKDLLDSGAS